MKHLTVIAASVALFLVLAIPLAMLNAWVLQIVWSMYAGPVFGLSTLTFGEALGVSLLASYLTFQYRPSADTDTEFTEKLKSLGDAVAFKIYAPLAVLGVAHIYIWLWPV